MSSVVRWCSAAAVLVMAFAPAEGRACVRKLRSFEFRAPADGATAVPTNARVWFGIRDESRDLEPTQFRLLRDDGTEVPSSRSKLESDFRSVLVLTPQSPLVAGSHYIADDGLSRTSFTVGPEADSTPPSVPSVASSQKSVPKEKLLELNTPICGGGEPIASVVYELQTDGILTVVDLNNSALLDGTSGRATDVNEGTSFFVSGKNDTTITVRFGAFDLAGNFSGFSEPRTEDLPDAPWGCSSTGGGTSPMAGAGFLLLAAVALLRRTRRS